MRLARRRLGLSQRELAQALGWSKAKVGRWEAGSVPAGFDEVVGLLRIIGFGVELTDLEPGRWTSCAEPAEHIVDRAGRHFPAHLDLCEENTTSTWNWSRHRSEPSPLAAHNSFRQRPRAVPAASNAVPPEPSAPGP